MHLLHAYVYVYGHTAQAFCAIFVYTTEAFPTVVRNFGLGACNVFTRIAGAITPVAGQVLLEGTGPMYTFMVYGAGCALATAASLALPFETRGRDADAEEESAALTAREGEPLLSK